MEERKAETIIVYTEKMPTRYTEGIAKHVIIGPDEEDTTPEIPVYNPNKSEEEGEDDGDDGD